jgi:hypothetical protein
MSAKSASWLTMTKPLPLANCQTADLIGAGKKVVELFAQFEA